MLGDEGQDAFGASAVFHTRMGMKAATKFERTSYVSEIPQRYRKEILQCKKSRSLVVRTEGFFAAGGFVFSPRKHDCVIVE